MRRRRNILESLKNTIDNFLENEDAYFDRFSKPALPAPTTVEDGTALLRQMEMENIEIITKEAQNFHNERPDMSEFFQQAVKRRLKELG